MSTILDQITITGKIPKMAETANELIINGQVYDKTSLQPIKFKTLPLYCDNVDTTMNSTAYANKTSYSHFYNDGCVVTDKYAPEYNFIIRVDRSGTLRVDKLLSEDGKLTKVNAWSTTARNNIAMHTYSQDINYIYGTAYENDGNSFIFRINKENCQVGLCEIGSTRSRVKILKETPLYIYYAYSRATDYFAIGKYTKGSNSKTDIYVDSGTKAVSGNTFSEPMLINENEVLMLRANKTFSDLNPDTYILKKYLIDYNYEKVYDKNVDLDCSALPEGSLSRIVSNANWMSCNCFTANDTNYFTLWHRDGRAMYLCKQTSGSSYSIIQEYLLPHNYTGFMPMYDGKTMVFFKDIVIDFVSFREFEEKIEMTESKWGSFKSICIDKNKIIWTHETNDQVEMVALNTPTTAEALFVETDLVYQNKDIETFLEVYCKNFDGALIETDIEVILTGPIKFADDNSKKKKIRTSSSTVLQIPVTIYDSGYVEANTFIS